MGHPPHNRELVLRDGAMIRVRPLLAGDRAIYERAVVDLSPRSRYLRFFTPIEKPSKRLLDQMTQTDGHLHVAYLAVTMDGSTALGAVRYILGVDDHRSAEVAIAVADDWQRRGLGSQVLRHTVEHAQRAGLRSLTALTLRENPAAAGLLRASGFGAVASGGLYAEHHIGLRP
jgi:ribosomal protein S18 acetylase RimI-like enzyme